MIYFFALDDSLTRLAYIYNAPEMKVPIPLKTLVISKSCKN